MLFSSPNTIAALITATVVIAAVALHYEALTQFSKFGKKHTTVKRRRVLSLVFIILLIHIVEIWLFAAGYMLMTAWQLGELAGMQNTLITSYVYYSASVYTTLGFGDIVPLGGPLQLLTGTEAITGLVLITWSASYTFLTMQRAHFD